MALLIDVAGRVYIPPRVQRPATEGPKFQQSVDQARTPQHRHVDEPHPGGVIIHHIQYGERLIKIGDKHGYSLRQLLAINPALRSNPDLIIAGDTLTILDQQLFNQVNNAIETTQEAITARQSAANIEEKLDGHLPPHMRKLYNMELPHVRQNADEKSAEAKALLQPGFLAAGLPNAHDEKALNTALETHSNAIAATGSGQPGFQDIVDGAEKQTKDELNEFFGPLRPSLKAALDSGAPIGLNREAMANWDVVENETVKLIDTLAKGSSDHEATVKNIGDILLSGGPVDNPAYVEAVNGAVEKVLVDRPVEEVAKAADDREAEISDPIATAELTKLDEVTANASPEVAARIAIGSGDIVDTTLTEMLHYPVSTGAPLETMPGTQIFDGAVDSLSVVAQRADKAEGGQEAVQTLAEPLVSQYEALAANSEDAALRLASNYGDAFQESVAAGRTPTLAIEVARQLNERGHTEAADRILERAAKGVDKQKEEATGTGQTFRNDILYVDSAGGSHLPPEQRLEGLEALLKDQKPLVEKVNRQGNEVVLTLEALEDLPADLISLEGGKALTAARDGLRKEVGNEKGDLTLTVRFSQDATAELERMANQQVREVMDKVPDEDLKAILTALSGLPPSSPYFNLVQNLGTGDTALQAMRDNPGLALMLDDVASRNGAPENPNEVPDAQNAGFISREVKNTIFGIAGFTGPDGKGLLPGLPLLPDKAATEAAGKANTAYLHRLAGRELMRAINPELNARGGYYQLSQMARTTWMKLNPSPKEGITASSGLTSRPLIGPAANGASMGLNLWGALTLLDEPDPMDRIWGGYFAVGTVKDLALAVNGGYAWRKGASPTSFSRIESLRGWSWFPRIYNWGGQGFAGVYTGYQFAKGDAAMGMAWLPATIGGFYGLTGAAYAGPVGIAGWMLTAILTTGISIHRRVEAANHHEPLLEAYLTGAYGDPERAKILSNCSGDGVPVFGALQKLFEDRGMKEEDMDDAFAQLFDHDRISNEELEGLVRAAHGVEIDEDGKYREDGPPNMGPTRANPSGKEPRYSVESMEELNYYVIDWDLDLPGTAPPEKE